MSISRQHFAGIWWIVYELKFYKQIVSNMESISCHRQLFRSPHILCSALFSLLLLWHSSRQNIFGQSLEKYLLSTFYSIRQSSYIYCGVAIGIFHCQTLFNFAVVRREIPQHIKVIQSDRVKQQRKATVSMFVTWMW